MATTAPSANAHTPAATPERWVAHFSEGWRAPAGARAFVEHFLPVLDPDVVLIQPQLPPVRGHRGFRERFTEPLFELIPDLRGAVENWAANGDTLYIELTLRGHLAGRAVSWRVCDRVTLRNGLAVERESYFDPSPLLGAVVRTPRAWPAFARLQLRNITNRLSTRRQP